MEVYNHLGPGLLESVYEKALIHELCLRGLHVENQVPVELSYKGVVLANDLRLDLIIEDTIIVELKSVEYLQAAHYKQLRTYLRLLNKPMGWLINFGEADFKDGMIPIKNANVNKIL